MSDPDPSAGANGAPPSASGVRSLGAPAVPLEIGDKKGERGRRDAIHAGGMADRAGARGIELLPNFSGEPGQLRIVEPLRQFQAFVPPIGSDVGGLPRQIDL